MPRTAEIREADVYNELSLYGGKTLREITESIRQKKKMRGDPTGIVFNYLFNLIDSDFARRREREISGNSMGPYEYHITPKGAENSWRYM